MAINWIGRIDWAESRVYVELEKEKIRQSPGYDPDSVINREYEEVMHDYYNRPGYWSS